MATGNQLKNVFFVLFILVDFGYIAIAMYFLDSCPKGPMLPLYNIVSAVYNVVVMYLEEKCSRCFSVLAKLLELSLLAAGSYWTYEIYLPDFVDEGSAEYCDQRFYAFCLFTIPLSCFIFVISLLFELCVKLCYKPRLGGQGKSAAEQEPEPPPPPPLNLFSPSFSEGESGSSLSMMSQKRGSQRRQLKKSEVKR